MSQLPSQTHDQPKLDRSASRGIRASLSGVAVSIGLGAVKVVAGVFGHSYALIADGLESILDVISGILVAASLKIAARPPDEKYPFGYGKVEPIVASAIALGLMAAAAAIGVQSVREIYRPHQTPAAYTLLVLVLVVISKELLFRFLLRTGASIESKSMESDAWHHRSDSLTSLAAFLGISIALIGGKGYESADAWAALFAAAVIAFNGLQLVRKAWREIMDAAVSKKVVDSMRRIAQEVDGVAGIDMCRVRKSGLGLWVDIHVEVHGDMTVRNGHEIAHRVKDALMASDRNVMDAVVHIEPANDAGKVMRDH